ncbi:MAG: hypothetical protein U1E76_14405 [Planctomycetota bacterium]
MGKRDFYCWYYASLALNQYSGPDSPDTSKTYWNKWNEKLVAALVIHRRTCRRADHAQGLRGSVQGSR